MNLVLLVLGTLCGIYAAYELAARPSGHKRSAPAHRRAIWLAGLLGRVAPAYPGPQRSVTTAQAMLHAHRRAHAGAALLGVLSSCVVLCGILLMQRTDTWPLLASVPTGFLADVFPQAYWILVGTICSALGCLGVSVWLPAYLRSQPSVSPSPSATDAAAGVLSHGRRARAGVMAGLAGAGLYAYVLLHVHTARGGVAVLLCLVASLVLFGLALGQTTRGTGAGERQASLCLTWRDGVVIVAVMAAFIAVTAHDLRSWLYAYWGDEWPFYGLAKAIAGGAPFDPLSQAGVYGYHPVADSAYQALVMRVFGLNVVGWRLSSVLAVAVPIPALYWLAKQMGGAVFAAAASVLYATCPLLWAYAHIGYNNNEPLLAMIPAVALLYAGLRRERAGLLFGAGALAGAGWYTFFSGRLMIGVLALVTLSEWRAGWRPALRKVSYLLAGFVVVVLPFVLDNGLDTIRQMSAQISLSPARATAPVGTLLWQNTVRAIYESLYAVDNSHYVVGAVFDVVSAAALCIGCIIAVRHVRELGPRVMLIWFGVTLALTTPLFYAPHMADTRLQVVIPAAALLAALGLCAACHAVPVALRRRERGPIFAACVAGALAVVVALNSYHFYGYATRLAQRWPPYPIVVATMEALTTTPGAVVVLPADMPTQDPNGDLCLVLDGFQIDPRTVVHISGRQVVPYCAAAAPRGLLATPTARLLLDTAGAVHRCRAVPSVVFKENQGTLWGYRFSVPVRPANGYAARLGRLALRACPALLT